MSSRYQESMLDNVYAADAMHRSPNTTTPDRASSHNHRALGRRRCRLGRLLMNVVKKPTRSTSRAIGGTSAPSATEPVPETPRSFAEDAAARELYNNPFATPSNDVSLSDLHHSELAEPTPAAPPSSQQDMRSDASSAASREHEDDVPGAAQAYLAGKAEDWEKTFAAARHTAPEDDPPFHLLYRAAHRRIDERIARLSEQLNQACLQENEEALKDLDERTETADEGLVVLQPMA
ncbi:hypothetical protein LTR85_010922 [Meristemomyces frigidus]|nr:hypothetical protein LTR85_010922 [Meristemomyces frigidus]